ncbi:helix-turn-helix domain-containing protein [Nocardia sp. NPDC049220]|uniref:helix-turn-helix domain-containing protein n=1 Tax=Nocardia sp. NPDC049220 TaxID=3155273 RepID=UPI0033DBFC40
MSVVSADIQCLTESGCGFGAQIHFTGHHTELLEFCWGTGCSVEGSHDPVDVRETACGGEGLPRRQVEPFELVASYCPIDAREFGRGVRKVVSSSSRRRRYPRAQLSSRSATRLAIRRVSSTTPLVTAFALHPRASVGPHALGPEESIHVDAAARRLVHTGDGLRSIAQSVGFNSVETLHRVFEQHFGVAPAVYRERFSG